MKTALELKSLAERKGWQPAEKLTAAQVHGMSSDELAYQQLVSADAINAALDEPARKRRTEEAEAGKKAQELFSGKEKPTAELLAEQTEWRSEHPQFLATQPNLMAVARELDAKSLLPTRINIEKIFQKLALAGELTLDGRIFNGPESLTGTTLQKFIRQCPEILDGMKPASEAQTLAQMSASEYKQKSMSESPADWRGVEGNGEAPPSVYQRIEKFVATAKSFRPAFVTTEKSRDQILGWLKSQGRSGTHLNDFLDAIDALTADGTLKSSDAVVKTSATTRTNFATSAPDAGYPQPDVSGSLQRKLARLSSQEYADFLKNNPSVKEALDRA